MGLGRVRFSTVKPDTMKSLVQTSKTDLWPNGWAMTTMMTIMEKEEGRRKIQQRAHWNQAGEPAKHLPQSNPPLKHFSGRAHVAARATDVPASTDPPTIETFPGAHQCRSQVWTPAPGRPLALHGNPSWVAWTGWLRIRWSLQWSYNLYSTPKSLAATCGWTLCQIKASWPLGHPIGCKECNICIQSSLVPINSRRNPVKGLN